MKSSSSTASSPESEEQILVGVILGPHGIRGEVAVSLQTDNDDRFAPGAELAATPRSGPGAARAERLRVRHARPHKGGLRVAFEGIEDRDAALRLRGFELSVPRSAVPAAAAGSYYHFELIGCRAFDEHAGELGEVVDVVADGGGWILEVQRRDGDALSRLSLPFVEAFLVRVDPGSRRIDWRLPAGLIDACASAS